MAFDSLEDAVKAAHREIAALEDSSKYEYMSIVYEDPKDGKFKYTPPKTEQKRRRAEVKIRIPKGSARALFHNHPSEGKGDNLQQFFSEGDIELSKKLGLPSFIGAGNSVYRWNPKEPGKMQSKGGAGSTIKEQVGIGELIAELEPFAEALESQPDLSAMFTGK